MRVKPVAIAALAALLAGCSGGMTPEKAASQDEVAMVPGQYTITVTNGKLAEFIDAEVGRELSVCANNEPRFVPTRLAREHMLGRERMCGTAKFDREGNRLTGSNACRIEDAEGLDGLDLAFDGVIEAERLAGTLKVSARVREGELDPRVEAVLKIVGNLETDLEAVRTGDC